ncbi:hypothetical protein, partial [Phocaeicola barnesiae]|uniref:hypothetical protein n=1 Tax=Phocaeicola barnesiae TaxID=376804 RepID=UPI001DD80281|nr:hypothetical protein [Phocaeicola barnesiae]
SKNLPSNLALKTVAKVSHIFVTTKFFRKFFSEKFFSGGPKRVPLRAHPFSLPCSMQGKILSETPPARHPAYTLSSEFHFFSAFPSRKRLQRYRLFRNLQAFLETFLKHFLELIHKYLINKRIKFNNFQDSESKGQRMTLYKFRARAYIGKHKRTHVFIQTNARFIENERTSSSKQTDVFDCWKTTDIHLP